MRSGVAFSALSGARSCSLVALPSSQGKNLMEDPFMSLATLSLDQILKTPFPSYHKPLELARSLTRSGNEDDRRKAVALLDGLRQRYPHVLAIGQELVLALEECHEPDRAEQTAEDAREIVPEPR